MIVGYARTSTIDQAAGLAAQERDLRAAGVERIFGEQVSSTAKRLKLAECLAFLREGDVLTVTKPDRLARSTAELLSIEADLSDRQLAYRSHAQRLRARFARGDCLRNRKISERMRVAQQ
jgi:DNA invertase Pin-like site-specific DNA recombinase